MAGGGSTDPSLWQTLFGGGSSIPQPSGYSGLSSDQSSLVNQQGWYPRSDMVMPTGSTLQHPQGYSNLTPAQANSVDQLGYYNNAQLQQPQSLWDRITKGLGTIDPAKLKEAAKQLGGPGDAAASAAPKSAPPAQAANTQYPMGYFRQQSPLDPKQALAQLLRGY